METGTSFMPVLADQFVKPEGVIQKVLICTGKVFYELVAERRLKQLDDKIAIVRVEQLCPFPYHLLAQEIAKYPNAKVKEFRVQELLRCAGRNSLNCISMLEITNSLISIFKHLILRPA